jgi:hypothetical protein
MLMQQHARQVEQEHMRIVRAQQQQRMQQQPMARTQRPHHHEEQQPRNTGLAHIGAEIDSLGLSLGDLRRQLTWDIVDNTR